MQKLTLIFVCKNALTSVGMTSDRIDRCGSARISLQEPIAEISLILKTGCWTSALETVIIREPVCSESWSERTCF